MASLLELGAPLPPGSVDRLSGDPAWQVRIGAVEEAVAELSSGS
ncbi:MAG: hypothetical protein ABW277_07965 [Longimicrobiaceae bacterium]